MRDQNKCRPSSLPFRGRVACLPQAGDGASKRLSILIGMFLFAWPLFAQIQGDEDANMQNHAKKRDQQAINEARKGWWTESMKTHDTRIEWWKEAQFGMFVHW